MLAIGTSWRTNAWLLAEQSCTWSRWDWDDALEMMRKSSPIIHLLQSQCSSCSLVKQINNLLCMLQTAKAMVNSINPLKSAQLGHKVHANKWLMADLSRSWNIAKYHHLSLTRCQCCHLSQTVYHMQQVHPAYCPFHRIFHMFSHRVGGIQLRLQGQNLTYFVLIDGWQLLMGWLTSDWSLSVCDGTMYISFSFCSFHVHLWLISNFSEWWTHLLHPWLISV